MTDINAILISATADKELVNRNGGSYRGAEVIYRNQEGQVQTKTRPNATKYAPQLAAKLQALAGKSEIPIVLRMSKNGVHWNLDDILSPAEAAANPAANPASHAPSTGSFSSGSSKPRAVNTNDVARIARAAALQAACQVAESKDVLKVAEQFAAFILEPLGVDTLGNTFEVSEAPAQESTTTPTAETLPWEQ